VSARVDASLAFQIRALRQKNEDWSQAELARRLETSQNAVCRLESPNYGKASISTLKKVASVFDVALVVRFVRFSTLVNDVINLSTESVVVDSFKDDQGLNLPTTSECPPERETTVPVDSIVNETLHTSESSQLYNAAAQNVGLIYAVALPRDSFHLSIQ
jgi:transcriptional regulator with XRE-family HTH domain